GSANSMTIYAQKNEKSFSDFHIHPKSLSRKIAQRLLDLFWLGLGQLLGGVAAPLAATLFIAQQLLGFLWMTFVEAKRTFLGAAFCRGHRRNLGLGLDHILRGSDRHQAMGDRR
ncbi:hypothetical protein, partial [Escherichia coli]